MSDYKLHFKSEHLELGMHMAYLRHFVLHVSGAMYNLHIRIETLHFIF